MFSVCSCIVARADAPWCGHCKSLAPEWAAAAAKTKKLSPPALLAKVDADAHKELGERYDVTGFPTIKIFRDGKAEDYDGPRETKGIVKFVKEALGIATGAGAMTRLKTADEAKALVAETGYALVGVFREPVSASSMFKTFAEVADELPSYSSKPLKVAYSASYKDNPVQELYGVKSVPALLLFRPGSDAPKSMPIPRKREEFTEDAVVEWIQNNM